MVTTYRVRYRQTPSGQKHSGSASRTADLRADLDQIPDGLPPGAYIMSIEDLTAGRDVHWTRWPAAYRPGFGGS